MKVTNVAAANTVQSRLPNNTSAQRSFTPTDNRIPKQTVDWEDYPETEAEGHGTKNAILDRITVQADIDIDDKDVLHYEDNVESHRGTTINILV